jgi:Cadherin-like domain
VSTHSPASALEDDDEPQGGDEGTITQTVTTSEGVAPSGSVVSGESMAVHANVVAPRKVPGSATPTPVARSVVEVASSAVSSPLRALGTDAPLESPVLLALLGWGRRESQRSLSGADELGPQAVSLAAAAANSAPTAVSDGPFAVAKDGSITLTWAQLVGNDTDPDGDVLSVKSVYSSMGTVVNNAAAKTVTFTPTAGYTGPASFVYRVKDAAGAVSANTATVSLMVTPPNTAPTAVNDGPFTVAKGGSITLTWAQLVGNDTDPDKAYGDVLSVKSVYSSMGTVVNNTAAKTVTFTPTAGYTGPASFVYRVKDATGAVSANTATVSITVVAPNSAPTAVNDGPFAVAKDGSITLTWAQLVGNDTDPDGDVLSVKSVYSSMGTVVNNAAAKTVTFTPTAGYTGPASFVYRVKDAAGAVSANTATVSLMVTPPNTAPTAVNDGPFTVAKGGSITLTWAQLVGNDTDPDKAYGDVLSVKSVYSSMGTVVNNTAAKTVTFTPTAGYTGPASFVYRVKDATGATSANTATVNITVIAAADSTQGLPLTGGVIVAANGTRYQVASDLNPQSPGSNGSTRVSILDADGKILSTTADIPGIALYNTPVTRADGSLLLTTLDGSTTRVSVISAAGVVTPVGSAVGMATGLWNVQPDGTAWTTVVDYTNYTSRVIRVSTANAVSTHDLGGIAAAPVVASGGTMYYLAMSSTGEATVVTIDSAGTESRTNLGVLAGAAQPIVASDGKVYVAAMTRDEAQNETVTKILTYTGSAFTVREFVDRPLLGTPLTAGQNGTVFLATGDSTLYQTLLLRITATDVQTIALNGPLMSFVRVGSNNTAYVLVSNGSAGSSLKIIDANGGVVDVPIPGETVQVELNGGNLVVGPDGNAYVAYKTAERDYVGVISSSGSIAGIPLPTGAMVGPTTVSPDGKAYTLVGRQDPDTGELVVSVVALATGNESAAAAGGYLSPSIEPLTFGPDGKVYRIEPADPQQGRTETRVLVVNPDGTTFATFSATGQVAAASEPGGLQGQTVRLVTFGPDGTGYVAISQGLTETGGTSSLWAVTPAGATKVFEETAILVMPPTIAPDGSVYVSAGYFDEATGTYSTKVHRITSPTVL